MEKIKRKTQKRLIININEAVHQEIKCRAAIRHISMTKWITRAIIEQIKKEKSFE